MRFVLSFVVLSALLMDILEGACPTIQKFPGTRSVTTCALNNPGFTNSIECTDTMTSFTISFWFRLSADDSIFSQAGSSSDVLFSVAVPGEKLRRLVVYYQFGTPATNGIYLGYGDTSNPGTQATSGPWIKDDSQTSYNNRRGRWALIVITLSSSGASNKNLNYQIGEFTETSVAGDYKFSTTFSLTGSSATSLTLTQDDILANQARLYIGGFPATTNTPAPVLPVNPNYGGCNYVDNLIFFPNHVPSDTDSMRVLMNYMFPRTTTSAFRTTNYYFRIKNIAGLSLINDCDVPTSVQQLMQTTTNTYIQQGLQFGDGDYLECVNQYMNPQGAFVFTLRFAFTKLPANQFNLVSLLYKSTDNFYPGTVTNGNFPVWFHFIKFGVFLLPSGKVQLTYLGLPHTLGMTLSANTGYQLTISARKISDSLTAGKLTNRTLFYFYINGVNTENVTMIGDIHNFNDSAGLTGTERNHYFYIGDFMINSINRYNYAFKTPNPDNSFGPNSTERSFSNTYFSMQDIQFFDNATVTSEANLLPSNCAFGVPETGLCIMCKSLYALDIDYGCQLKTSLPTYIVFSNYYDLTIECGYGLFFNTGLNICQNCPTGCAACTSISNCILKTSGCTVSNCAKCDSTAATCLGCNSGYTLSGSNTCLVCNVLNCAVCPSSNTNTCTTCVAGKFFDSGSATCANCDPNCATCATLATTCLTCGTGKYLLNGVCYTLSTGTYLWNAQTIVRNCFPTCTSCITSEINKCSGCDTNSIPVLATDSVKSNQFVFSCDSVCPSTHYITTEYLSVTGTFCLPCAAALANCISCHLPSLTSKLICKKCSAGFYVNVDAQSQYTNNCAKCDASCTECSGSPTNCVACTTGQVLTFDSTTSTFKCVADTKTSASTNRVCPRNMFLYQGQCLKECPQGTYRRRFWTDDCASCDTIVTGCSVCNGDAGVCTTCNPLYKLSLTTPLPSCYSCNQNGQQCCPPGFGWTTGGTCSACTDTNSASCFIPSFSTSCNTGYILNAVGICKIQITSCASYDFQGVGCLLCTGTNKRSSATSCIAACAGSTYEYILASKLTCQGCHASCATCTQPLTNNRCGSCVGTSRYIQKELGCYQCPFASSCSSWGTDCTCNTCSSGFNQNGVCYPTCSQSGFFLNGASCSNCAGCSTCTSTADNGCASPRTCLTTHQLDASGNACCLPGRVYSASTCSLCNDANCKICSTTAAGACTTTKDGYFLNTGAASACNAIFNTCRNTGTAYEILETCKFGSTSYFNPTPAPGAWVSQCATSLAGTCGSHVSANSTSVGVCALCTGTNYLDPSAYTCVAACPTGWVGVLNMNYTIFGVPYNGRVCLPSLSHVSGFSELYYYNVDGCAAGYYRFKSGSSISPHSTLRPNFEVIMCGKCHPDCKTCYDYSSYACSSCDTSVGKVLYMSTCLSACPLGFVNTAGVCIASTCKALEYKNGAVCTRRCPLGMFGNNNTWTCDNCDTACLDCWGPASTDCRTCATSAGLAFGDGTCKVCATNTYMDNYFNFTCAPFTLNQALYSMAAGSADPQLTGVKIVDSSGVITSNVVDAAGYLQVPNKGLSVTIPTLSFTSTRICYQYLVEYDLTLKETAGTFVWHTSNFFIKNGATEIGKVPINKWDFETNEGVYVGQTYKLQQQHFVANTNCTTTALDLVVSTDVATTGPSWGAKNLRVYWFLCPLECISCTNSITCERCKEGKFYYSHLNECQVPYTTLMTDPTDLVEVFTFLFRPKSVYLYFSKNMNFSLADKFPYFFPTFTFDSSGVSLPKRLLQTLQYQNSQMRFNGNNMVELEIPELVLSQDLQGKYTFRYPLVDRERTGYNFTGLPVTYKLNTPSQSFMSEYVQILVDNKNVFRYVMTGLSLLFMSALGANWMMIESCQKLYMILFLSVTYSKDFEDFLSIMDFSFFGWFQQGSQYFLGSDQYFTFTKYDEYLTVESKDRVISKDFLDYIPPRKLGKHLVRKSLLIHLDNVIVLMVVFAVVYLLMIPIRLLVLKKYYYKESLVNFLNGMHNFFQFKFFVRYVCLMFPPVVFYGMGNITKLEMAVSNGAISAYMTFAIMAIWGLAFIQYFVSAILMPSPAEQRNITEGWRANLLIPFKHFMEFYKHPEDPNSALKDADADDEQEDEAKKVKDVDNKHLVIKELAAAENNHEVFTLVKDQLKKGGAKVYKVEEKIDPKDKEAMKKKKNQPAFVPISRIKEMEAKEREEAKKKKEEEAKKAADKKKVGNDKPAEDEDEKKSNSSDSSSEKEKSGEKEGSSSSEDGDKTDESDDELGKADVRNVGKLLSKAVSKIQKGPGCCECKTLRKNKCLNKFNYIMEKSAKYYTLIRILHIAALGALSWHMGDKPDIQVIAFAASQTAFFLWTVMTRPFMYLMLNISVCFVEFCFTGIAWLIFLVQGGASGTILQVYYLILTILSVCIFASSLVTFLGFFLYTLGKWMSSLGSKDPL